MVMSNIVSSANVKKILNYLLYLLIAASFILILWFGYSWYKKGVEESASKDLASNVDGYYKALSRDHKAETWMTIEQAFSVGSRRHKGSKLYPYFLAYQADSLLQLGKLDEAISVLDNAVNNLDKQSDLYPLYFVKRALMKIDSKNKAIHDSGMHELSEVASNSTNPMQGMAIYYQGLYKWSDGNKRGATDIWRGLKKDTTFYQLAQAKIQGNF